jgi:hypothetical protein
MRDRIIRRPAGCGGLDWLVEVRKRAISVAHDAQTAPTAEDAAVGSRFGMGKTVAPDFIG